MPGELLNPELAASIPEAVSYAVAAAGVSLGGIAWKLGRQRLTLQERLRISEERRRLDAKTGLLNYPAFEEEFEKRTGNTQRQADTSRRHGLVLADIDDFKALNTQLSHPVTDKVALIPVANAFKQTVRPESDAVCRFGGEEFVALLSDTDEEGALTVCKRLQESVNDIRPKKDSPEKRLGLTIAYATFAQGTPLASLMEQLSAELTQAKAVPGKNQIVAPPQMTLEI